MELKVFNTEGKEVSTVTVKDEIFATEYNEALIHQVVVAQLANKRQGTKSTLTRTEVRGGGRKPWRQKGTGNARQGSIRSPQWIHGGVVFAPKPRDFSKKINKKMNEAALKSALSQKIRQNEFVVLDKLDLAEGKTKFMVSVCEKLDAGKKAMFVMAEDNQNVLRASSNLKEVDVCNAKLINVYDIVRAGKMFVTLDSLKVIEGDNE
ncbi:MAG: 50S ribosomal protein L4 [Clostridia bacterium]|nr:50S ribosomal protein L4 [Clostridia bacterium]